jgi:bifunctional isochorismate lyase/aryl carrier protein
MQRYFVDAFAGRPPVGAVIANIGALRERCRLHGVPVVYSAQPGNQSARQRGLGADFWGPGMSSDPDQQTIVEELTPGVDDIVVTKLRYSAFHDTRLRELLRQWGRDQLVVTGIYAHIGCLATACDAFMHDIQAFLVADAVGDFGARYHRMALAYAARRCAVVTSTTATLADLSPDTPLWRYSS